jgi:hypothetical protein
MKFVKLSIRVLKSASPADIDLDEWQNREDEGVLFVPKAGEALYRIRNL